MIQNDQKNAPFDWSKNQILAALHDNGSSWALVGERYGVSGNTIAQGIGRNSELCQRRVADALGLHPAKIWPNQYHENGVKKQPHYRRKSTAKTGTFNAQIPQSV